MDSRRPRPSTGPSSNGGGHFLQGVWMSKCESGRIERLTKWSDGQKNQKLGSIDQQEHSSMVRMNLKQLEIRDELAALKKSRKTPVSGQKGGMQEITSPNPDRKHGKPQDKISNSPKHDRKYGITQDKVSSASSIHERNKKPVSSSDSGASVHRSPIGLRSLRVGERPKDVTVPHGSASGKMYQSAAYTHGSGGRPPKTKTGLTEPPASSKTSKIPVTTQFNSEERPKPSRKFGRVEMDEEVIKILNGMRDHVG